MTTEQAVRAREDHGCLRLTCEHAAASWCRSLTIGGETCTIHVGPSGLIMWADDWDLVFVAAAETDLVSAEHYGPATYGDTGYRVVSA